MKTKISKKSKIIIISILVGFIGFPTLTLGGSFTLSLIQGKSVDEAVQILAEQIDVLTGRVEKLESEQQKQEEKISETERMIWCNEAEDLSKRVVAGREMHIEEAINYYNQYPPNAEGVLENTHNQFSAYLEAKEKCGEAETQKENSITHESSNKEEVIESRKQVELKKATGIINVYFEKEGSEMKEIEKDHSLEGSSMIASTRFQDSKTGLIFRTTEAITVPHGYFLSVPVTADNFGEEYLLKCSAEDPCLFTIPGYKGTEAYTQRYGKAFSDFSY